LIASGGGHYFLELLFGEASREDCELLSPGSQLDSLKFGFFKVVLKVLEAANHVARLT
jgi:hypothetical protein